MENPAKKSNHSILTIKNDHVVHFAAYYFIKLHLYTSICHTAIMVIT